MTDKDYSYYERRAREEIAKAEACTDPSAKRAHLILATRYRNKLVLWALENA